MSTHFTLRCDECEVDGPVLRWSGQGVRPMPLTGPEHDPADADLVRRQWEDFLTEHEWCGELRLVHE